MKPRKMHKKVICSLLVWGVVAGCGIEDGRDDDPQDFCAEVEPCVQVGCTTCDWPEGSCRIDQEEIYSIDLPSWGSRPHTVLIDLVVSSVIRSGEDRVCSNPVVKVDSPGGELFREALSLDQNRRICVSSSLPGRHSVSLLCSWFPTRAGYRVSVVDARGQRVWR